MNIVSKPYIEHTVRDIDVLYLGGGTASVTLYEEDVLTELPDRLQLVLTSQNRNGRVDIFYLNTCEISYRTRTVQEPVTEPPVPPTKETAS